ncbi:MAG: ribonuclease HII [Gammaproteobacteria bacterium]|nr:ribonuclease HII [Gammaproteobacteria bacterium]
MSDTVQESVADDRSVVVAGVDEAGRGPLAGAVVAAVVVIAPGQVIAGVRDSKLLTARRRAVLARQIRDQAQGWALGRADVDEIDRFNILQATFLAMQRAVAALAISPACIMVDGNRAPRFSGFAGEVRAVVGGDRSCAAISAASILAKVARDEEMCSLHLVYPQYGFDDHKGYPTAAHREALRKFGPCPAHRSSFGPVREARAGAGTLWA